MSSDVDFSTTEPARRASPSPLAPMVHQAVKMRADGRVRAACQTDRSDRPLGWKKRYVTRPDSGAVTCQKCLKAIAAKAARS